MVNLPHTEPRSRRDVLGCLRQERDGWTELLEQITLCLNAPGSGICEWFMFQAGLLAGESN